MSAAIGEGETLMDEQVREADGRVTGERRMSEARHAPEHRQAPPPDEPPTRSLRERLRLPLMVGVPLLAIAGGLYYYLTSGRYQSTDDAYVRAAQVSISTNVSGRVSEVDVRDNQRVHRGETLFRLDERPFRIAVEEARARLASARLQIESLKATYRQRQADLKSAQSALTYQQREYDREMRLLKSGIASQAQADRALLARNTAQQNVAAAQQQITSVLASLGGNPDIPVDRHPTVEQAQAELDRALLNLSYTTIAAPIDGIVTRVEQLQVGDYINAATPAFMLVSTHDVWIEANFKEDQLAHMHAGQTASVSIDAYPGRKFEAKVTSVSPGTGSEFSLLPPENATGNWVKVVQRLPVRLQIEGDVPPMRAGLSATVTVDTQYQHSLFGGRSADHAELSAQAGE
jgi:membrane fusion protein, multidrug efflux system